MLYDGDDAHYGRIDPFGNVLSTQIEIPVTPYPIQRLLPETHAEYVYGKAANVSGEAVWGMNRVWLDWLVEQPREQAQKVFQWQPQDAGLRKITATERKDWLGNVVEQVSVKGEIEQRRYDAACNEIWRKDRDGREWCREIVSWDLIGAQVNALGHRVRYEYNTTEHVTKIVDGGGTTSEYRYDAKDRLVEVWRHGAKREEYVYNELDQFEEKRDGAGRIMLRIRPHENGLPRYIEPAVGRNLLYAYDEHGRATEATVGFVKVELARDVLSRRLYDLRKQRGVVHEHQPNGSWKSTLFGKFVMQASKRSDGVVEITSPSGKVERLYCDHWGAVHRSTSAGTQALLQYNEHGQLLARMIWRKGGSVWTTKYVRSPEGLIARIEDSIKGTTHYELDAAARLIAEVTPSGERHEYVHDAANNLIKIPGVRSIELRAGNQLLRVDHEEFTYNERHHVSERARANGRWIYSYDSFDQLIQASWKPIGNAPSKEWTAEYDGLGRRISKTWNGRTTEYYWDGDRLAAEVSPSGALRVYVYAAMDALSPCAFVDYPSVNTDESEGKHYTVFHDALGLAVWIEDEAGTPVWWPQFVESYGYVKPSTQSRIEYNLRWPGHYWDHELSLVYNRYRYYDCVLARYLQSDPLGTMGGINLYAYASNPLVDVDLLGLAAKKNCNNNTKSTGGSNFREEEPVTTETVLSTGKPVPEGTKKVSYGGGESTFLVDPQGKTIRAEVVLNPPTNYVKHGVSHIKPQGFISGVDDRGHLGPERGVAHHQVVNVPENVVAENARASNRSVKKRWENAVIQYAKTHPGSVAVSEPVFDATGRPTGVTHMLLDHGVEVKPFSLTIPNPTDPNATPTAIPLHPANNTTSVANSTQQATGSGTQTSTTNNQPTSNTQNGVSTANTTNESQTDPTGNSGGNTQ